MLRPLPASALLPRLAARHRLVALSNHRAEWLRPVLERTGLERCFEALFISSETGFVKPDPRAI